ncbi:MAG: metal-sensitive transcriptional regulator [Actinobacteria bacterium]|nr:metal-sensitive transcriptional regulator [Actinomycetota bacterium]
MKPNHRTAVLNRLKSARGHLDAVIRMVDDDQYCPDVMKQLAAVQGSLEGAGRVILRNHLETCVAAGMMAGRVDDVVDELMNVLRFDRVTGPGDGDGGRGTTEPTARGVDAERQNGCH